MIKTLILFSLFIFSTMLMAKELTLNGTGFREATIFNIKVYKAELYLENKTSNANSILNSNEEKKMSITFLREVDKEKLVSTWEESFEKNLGKDNFNKIRPSFEIFKTAITEMKENDNWTILFHGTTSLDFIDKNKVSHKIEDAYFLKSLLSIWIGDTPPNESLKKGLLGL